jgi:hypothetical protein
MTIPDIVTIPTYVDPLATLIAYVRSSSDVRALVGERIAVRHKFAMADQRNHTPGGWLTPSAAITITPIGSDGEDPINCRDAAMYLLRCTLRCFGRSEREAMAVYRALLLLDQPTAKVIHTPDGSAYLYYFLIEEAPVVDLDPDLRVDFVSGTIRAGIARHYVEG